MKFSLRHKSDEAFIKSSRFFNKKWYVRTYPDVLESGINPIEHYLKIGWKCGYNPSDLFDGNAYLKVNNDVKKAGMNPLLHYEKYGRYEGRSAGSKIKLKRIYKLSVQQKLLHYIKKYISRLVYCRTIKQNKNKRVLVVLHLFYMEAWEIIKSFLDNLQVYDYDLIVTYVRNNCDRNVLEKIKYFHKSTKFYMYSNKGFDIGPFVDVLHKINLSKYDIVFKLHSKGVHRKRIYIYNQIFKNKDWFWNLYNGILGEFTVHKAIDAFSKNEKIGLVASENLIVHDPRHKQCLTKKIAEQYNISLHKNYLFVAGSCFVVKAKLLEEVKKYNLTIKNFSKVQRGIFSLAHAMERIICAMVEKQKGVFYGIKVSYPVYHNELKVAQKMSALRLLEDRRFVLDSEFVYRGLEGKNVLNYYVKKIALKDINRSWKGKILKLSECAPYVYLDGDSCLYDSYCKENKRIHNVEMSKDRYDRLISSIELNGFNTKSMPVINVENNIIMDGQHRSCCLLKKFGDDYKVRALFIEFARK